MLKILQVAAPTPAGGLERVVESLAVGHARRGHDVTVLTLLDQSEDESHPFVDALTKQNVSVRTIRLAPKEYLRERREVAAVCRELRPDVVHTHGYRVDLLNRPVAARLGIPTVTTVHGASKMGGWKGAFFEWLQRRNYRRFDGVVAVSKDLYETTVRDGVAERRLFLVPNAWSGFQEGLPRREAREALGLDERAKVLGWVGRLIRVKGGDVFLEALSRLPEPRPVAAMIGYGPEGPELSRQAEELGLGSCLRFYSDIRDAGRYFAAFDAFVLSSRSEGLPIVVLEAMAARIPIVATEVGGVPEALGDEGGWLVRPEDPAALAQAIGAALGDQGEAAERVRSASRRLETDFSIHAFLDGYENVYRAVTGIFANAESPESGSGTARSHR